MLYSIFRCGTCSKGFLRRERYITHVRIHTGEKPFVCGVCSRGYRDKRELKKHQITHNHVDGNPDSPPAPTTAVVSSVSGGVASINTAPPPAHLTFVTQAAVPATRQTAGQGPITAVAVSPVKHVSAANAVPTMAIQTSQPQYQNNSSSMATITFSLPTEPVPKNQLGLAPDPPSQVYAPLNPAQIQLPPSVAAALQNMNNKVMTNKPAAVTSSPAGIVLAAAPTTPVKQELIGGHFIKQIQGQTLEGIDGNQFTIAAGSLPGLISSNGSQVFYYVMPNTMQPLMAEGPTAAVRATGAEGGATQFLALPAPAGALQATVPVSSVNGAFPQWIIGKAHLAFYCTH